MGRKIQVVEPRFAKLILEVLTGPHFVVIAVLTLSKAAMLSASSVNL